MKKRILAVLLATVMTASILAGCSSSSSDSSSDTTEETEEAEEETEEAEEAEEETEEAEEETEEAEETTESASSGETVSLSVLAVTHTLTQDITDMEYVAEMEEEANVEVEWEQIRTDWDTTKSTRFASGDVPDILMNATSDSDYVTYDGLFVDLSEYISEELTPNIYAMFEEQPDTKTLATTVDGAIYGLPKYQGCWPDSNTVMFINQTWLDNLGLEKPTTLSELKEVLIAFRDEDANGNGDTDDEIPLDFNGGIGGAYSLMNLVGSMGIQLTDWGTYGYFAEDYEIKNYAVDERFKLLMEYLADLYAEGLINVNAITNDYSTFQSLSRGDEDGNAIVGVVFGWEETDKFGSTLYVEYSPLSPLDYDIDCEAGTYDTRWTNDHNGLNMSSNRVCITTNCDDIEAALRFIDRFYDSTHSVEVLFGGITDGCVEQTGDEEYTVLDPLDPDTDSGTWKWTSTFADNGPMYIRATTTIDMADDMTYALEEREYYTDVLAKADESDTYSQMFMKYSADDEETMSVLQTAVSNITDNQWALWLTGEADIESTWDSYVESVYNAGLQDILDIRQAAFDEYIAAQ